MSVSNDTNMTVASIFAVTGLLFTVHHTYKFDKWKCLIPRRKEWFRVLLTWMLIMSDLGLMIWGFGWCYAKYKLGWVVLPGYGAVPLPNELWPKHYKHLNVPLSIWLTAAYGLQVSMNAEEGLYWYHLMRAVRQPKSAKSWLSSSFFITWIAITVASFITQYGVAWIGNPDMETQMARMFTAGGVIELIVLLAASIVIVKFPAFLNDVKSSGAGPEVRSRLHFYQEANKVRTFFRLSFTICILILGIDGLTERKRINRNHIASDLLQQIAYGSYFFAYIASVVLYLPRNWGSNHIKSSAQVMVGRVPPQQEEDASHALMSLLREGGQWDDEDDLRAGRIRSESRVFEHDNWDEPSPLEEDRPVQRVQELHDFTSPLAVKLDGERMPSELRIRVHQEVEDDANPTPRIPV